MKGTVPDLSDQVKQMTEACKPVDPTLASRSAVSTPSQGTGFAQWGLPWVPCSFIPDGGSREVSTEMKMLGAMYFTTQVGCTSG